MLDSEGPYDVLRSSPIAISTSCQSNAQSGRLEMLSSSYMTRYACYMKSDASCSTADCDAQGYPEQVATFTPWGLRYCLVALLAIFVQFPSQAAL